MTKKSDEKSDVKAVHLEPLAMGQSVGLGEERPHAAKAPEPAPEAKADALREAKDEGRHKAEIIAEAGVRDLKLRIQTLEMENDKLAGQLTAHLATQPVALADDKATINAVAAAIHKHHPISGGCADGTCARAVIAALGAK